MKISKIIMTLFLLITGIISIHAQSAKSKVKTTTSEKPTIVFVHGLWADGSSWSKVMTILQAQGYNTIAVQNPATSLEDDINATKRALDRIEGPVVLVGHSWGGFVITQAGNDAKVKSLVYVAALVPDEGETIPVLSANAPGNNLGTYFESKDGFIKLSKAGVSKAFAQDLTAKEQAIVYATQTPASEAVFGAKSGTPAWKTKPSFFVVAKKDGAINPALERFMSKRIKAKTIELDASHVLMISKPQEVSKLIIAACK